jgi:hypothetical protein
MRRGIPGQEGQGLVEYAMVLVLLVIAVLVTLMGFGYKVANVLYNPIVEQFDSGPLLAVAAERTGGGHGNDVVVTIAVDLTTSVSVSDSQSGQSTSTVCAETCQVTLSAVGHRRGTVTVTVGGDRGMAWYPRQP